jgi:cytochrome c oxidase subunit II
MRPLIRAILIATVLVAGLAACRTEPSSLPVIKIVMKKYDIEPAEIRLKRGELVELEISTEDKQHGFAVKGLNISESVQPGRATNVQLQPETAGEYEVTCDILCGSGHDRMRAKIVVK